MTRKRHDHAERWDKADVRELRRLHKRGYTYTAIAVLLGRTPRAIASKLYRLHA